MPKEITFTENVSPRGIRATTARRWRPETHVLFGFLRDGGLFQGRVVYGQRKESGDFAIGVELSGQVQSRMRNLI